jgi:DNA-binding response OmpR family regulator
MSSVMRLALIEDDSGLLTVLERRFSALGWERQVLSYAPAPEQLAALRLHALVVNPELTGLDYVGRVASALPGLALFVCAGPAGVADRVRALRAGADDWIPKPCHPEELVARIEAVVRRRSAGTGALVQDAIQAGELVIRPDRFDAHSGEESAGLSRREYELLYELASAEGRVLEREEIYQRVWGYTMAHGDRSVDVFVRKLRQKLERISPGWRYVHTHFGIGYRFSAETPDGVAAPVADGGATASEPVGSQAEPARRTAERAAPAADPVGVPL